MVSELLAASRPGVSAAHVVDIDDEFTDDHSICKGNDSRVAFELTIYDKSRHQALMNGTHIADRLPNEFLTSLDLDFFVDSSHKVSLSVNLH
jgi:hypothetical protein